MTVRELLRADLAALAVAPSSEAESGFCVYSKLTIVLSLLLSAGWTPAPVPADEQAARALSGSRRDGYGSYGRSWFRLDRLIDGQVARVVISRLRGIGLYGFMANVQLSEVKL